MLPTFDLDDMNLRDTWFHFRITIYFIFKVKVQSICVAHEDMTFKFGLYFISMFTRLHQSLLFLVVIQKSFSTIVYNKTKLIKDTIRLRLAIKLSRIKQNSFLLQHGIFYSCYIHQISHFKFPYIRYRIPT